jgi:enamine deaminase RidA (YjgF/YER057c/UK114 family)
LIAVASGHAQQGGERIDTRAIAEFERGLPLEHQREGVAKAKKDGKYKGRQPTARAKAAEVIKCDAEGLQRTEIARRTGIGTASVYRVLADATHATSRHKRYRRTSAGRPIYPQAGEVAGASRTLYLSGQVGIAADGSVPEDAEARCALAWRNLQAQTARRRYGDRESGEDHHDRARAGRCRRAPAVRQCWADIGRRAR